MAKIKPGDMKKWEGSAADAKDDAKGIAKAKSKGAPPFGGAGKGKGMAPSFGKGARKRG